MSLPLIFTALNGAMGLYSNIKGMIDASKAKSEQERLARNAQIEENNWYRRNYFGNYLDSVAARAAIKRVEDLMRRQGDQNRARSAIMGATPEYAQSLNENMLQQAGDILTGMVASEGQRRNDVDAMHNSNRLSLLGKQNEQQYRNAVNSTSLAENGMNLFRNALLGVNWGREG